MANFCISFITFAVSLRYYYDKKQIAKSVEAFKLALDINPMHEGIWFTLGLGIGWVGLWIARSQPVELLSALRDVIITSYHIILVFRFKGRALVEAK